jgi:type I restriction enzyme S subunit
MSKLPTGWVEAAVTDVVALHDSQRVPLNATQRSAMRGTYPYYGANGQVDCVNDYLFDGDYVLLAEDGGNFDDPIRGVAYEASGKFWVNNHAHILEPLGDIPVRFLRHLLNATDWMPFVGGTTRLKLTQAGMQQATVPVPPLPEQRRIVTKIDSLSAKTGRARARLDHVPRLVEKYKQAILAAAFRGDLTQEWRSQAGWPRNWEDTTLGQLLVDIRYGTAKKCGYDAGAVGVLRIPNVQLGKISVDDLKSADFTDDELKKLRLEEGDILIIRSNGSLDLVGRSAVVDSAAAGLLFAGYLIRLRLNPELAYPKFVQLYLRTTETRTLVERLAKSTSGVNNINSTQIQQLPISRPDIDEQHEIVRLIDIAFAWVDRLASETTGARKLVDHLDQAVLSKAFKGELVPQDPNDEPASVLLQRIQAERAKTSVKPSKLTRSRT